MDDNALNEIQKIVEAKNSGMATDDLARQYDLHPQMLVGFFATLRELGVDVRRTPPRLSQQTREAAAERMRAVWAAAGGKKNGKAHIAS